MTKPFSISLKCGERIFINGAVVRTDRKVCIEFLNDVTFLLEAHVMQPEQTTTPFRQLYFTVQAMLIDPNNTAAAKQQFDVYYTNVFNAVTGQELLNPLAEARRAVDAKRYFEALKILRGCFPVEDAIIKEGGKQKLKAEQEH
jgi:flagellar protein FlbT